MIAIPIICPEIDQLNPKTSEEYLEKYLYSENPPTYTMDGQLQCRGGRRRSIQDLYGLLKTKFPNYTMSELQNDLINVALKAKGEGVYIGIFRCSDIGRVVVTPLRQRYEPHFLSRNIAGELASALFTEDEEYITIIQNLINLSKNENYLQYRISENQESSSQ